MVATFPIILYDELKKSMAHLEDYFEEIIIGGTTLCREVAIKKIHKIFKKLFFKKGPITQNRISDLCYRFWCLQAYESPTKGFKKPEVLTQPISKTLFLIRLMLLIECNYDNHHVVSYMNPQM
jgi:hypothetical protein